MYTINDNHLEVLVKGRPITEYNHKGSVYVEGRKGSEYVIRYRNNSSTRKKIVVSVDGLNVISGNVNWKMGYVVEPWATCDIPGWRKDDQNVAKFRFSSVGKSYNQHNDHGDEQNVGVIGVKVFHEDVWSNWQPPVIKHVYHHYDWGTYWPRVYYNAPTYTTGGITGGAGGIGVSLNNTLNDGHNVTCNAMNAGQGSSAAFATATASCGDRSRSVEFKQLCASDPEPQQSIGTAWGKNAEFKTGVSSYKFYDNAYDTLLIYYDSREGLQRRGINLARREYRKPDAFPTYGGVACPPPK